MVPHNPLWSGAFANASAEIAAAMGGNLVALHHIGSTAIPGIHAKPIIDMLAVAADLGTLDRQSERMKSIGYEAMGEFGIAGRRYFRRDNEAGDRTHQIHAFLVESPHIARHLAFRDYLRGHPAIAAKYSDLKRQLAARHPHDMTAYMDGKDPFIKEAEARAMAWHSNQPR